MLWVACLFGSTRVLRKRFELVPYAGHGWLLLMIDEVEFVMVVTDE